MCRRLRSEAGSSLVEMVLAMALGLITVAVVGSLVVDSQTAAGRVTQRVDATQRGRVALEQMLQQLRAQSCLTPGTPTLLAAEDTRVRFYADLTAREPFVPEIRELRWEGSSLVEERWVGTGAAPATVWPPQPKARVLAERIARPAGADQAIFRYFGFATAGTPGAFTRLAAPLSAGDRARVVQIQVEFRSRGGSLGQTDVPLTGTVLARTADANDPGKGAACS